MNNFTQQLPLYRNRKYPVNLNEGIGLAGDMKALERTLSQRPGSDLGRSVFKSGDWAEQFKIGDNPRLRGALFDNKNPSILGDITDSVGGLLDKVGGLGGVGDLLAGFGAWQSAKLQKDRLEEERAARLFSNNITRGNFNNQVSTLNTQLRDRQNSRNARASNDGSVMSTADYMAANGLNRFNG